MLWQKVLFSWKNAVIAALYRPPVRGPSSKSRTKIHKNALPGNASVCCHVHMNLQEMILPSHMAGGKSMRDSFGTTPWTFQNIPAFQNSFIFLQSIHDTLMNLKTMKSSLCALKYDSSNNQAENEGSIWIPITQALFLLPPPLKTYPFLLGHKKRLSVCSNTWKPPRQYSEWVFLLSFFFPWINLRSRIS